MTPTFHAPIQDRDPQTKDEEEAARIHIRGRHQELHRGEEADRHHAVLRDGDEEVQATVPTAATAGVAAGVEVGREAGEEAMDGEDECIGGLWRRLQSLIQIMVRHYVGVKRR